MNTKTRIQAAVIPLILCLLIAASVNAKGSGNLGKYSVGIPPVEIIQQNKTIMNAVVSDGPGFIMVSALDLHPFTSTTEWDYVGPACLYNPSYTVNGLYTAGLTLPHGATITKLTLYYLDFSTSDNISLILGRTSIAGEYSIVAQVATDGALDEYRYISTVTIDYPQIDNQDNSYFLLVEIPTSNERNLQVVSVRIDYGYSVDLPLVEK